MRGYKFDYVVIFHSYVCIQKLVFRLNVFFFFCTRSSRWVSLVSAFSECFRLYVLESNGCGGGEGEDDQGRTVYVYRFHKNLFGNLFFFTGGRGHQSLRIPIYEESNLIKIIIISQSLDEYKCIRRSITQVILNFIF